MTEQRVPAVTAALINEIIELGQRARHLAEAVAKSPLDRMLKTETDNVLFAIEDLEEAGVDFY